MKSIKQVNLDIEKLPSGHYLATSRDVQGLVVQAKTFEKTIEIAEDLAKKLLALQAKNTKKKTTLQSERIFYPMLINTA